jgi:hypothetical protein
MLWRGKFSTLKHPHLLWGPLIQGCFPWGKSGWGMNLTTDLHLVLKLSTNGDLPRVPHINAWLALGKLYKLGMKYRVFQKELYNFESL